uniref:Uncharacterized protein n=1 Tax=Peromyscus maniculatus bairdii TaxID=230844 RepID=A0A8C8W411_PERMB
IRLHASSSVSDHLLLCLFMCNDRFGGVVCFHFYCNVIVFIQLEISDSTVSESPNVLVSPVLCFMPKNLKLISHFNAILKIPNQNVASGSKNRSINMLPLSLICIILYYMCKCLKSSL